MALQLRGSRVKVSKLTGAIVAVFALFMQPLVALDLPSAFAATADVTKLAFTTTAQAIDTDEASAVMTVQTQNFGSTSEVLDTPSTKLLPRSSSPTGEFSPDGTSGWTSTPSYTMASGSSNKNFYYKDSSAGTFNLTATATDNVDVTYPWISAAQNVTVAAPVLTLAQKIAATAANGTVELTQDETVPTEINITKPLTINGNGYTLSPNFTKTSNSNNATIGILGINNVTINNLTIEGIGGTTLHGINIYESAGVVLNDLTVRNNDRNGIVVNGSSVSATNLVTSGNGWGGVNIDQGSGVTTPAAFELNGASDLSDIAAIVIDNPSNPDISLTDTTGLYSQVAPGVYQQHPPIPACDGTSAGFDTFSLGSVNGQSGWKSTGSYDQSIVDNIYGYNTFGCKSLRISNAVTSGGFGDQTFSSSAANEAGETDATNAGESGGTRQNYFEASFDIASTQLTQQNGLFLSVSPDRGDGSRMSYLSFRDGAGGLDVTFYDVRGTGTSANFVPTSLGTISRDPHTIKFSIDYLDGPSNDVVKIYVDGVRVHTGTTWENYYRYDSEASAEPSTRTTDSLLFRVSGAAAPATSGKGFLIDNFNQVTTFVAPDTTGFNFVGSPKYVRANNAGDETARIIVSEQANAARFYVDGSLTPISGTFVGPASATTERWKLNTPLAPGEHTITAEVRIGVNWYDVNGTGTAYSIDAPTAEYVVPGTNQFFRPNDRVVRVKVDDEFNQFKEMKVVINSVTTTVARADCTDTGAFVLCDVSGLNLPEGTYTATTTTYTKANNRYDNLVSNQFTIDNTAPVVTNLAVDNQLGGVVGNPIIASANASDTNGVESVNFYVTAPRISDGACTGNGTKLAEQRVFSTDGDGKYRATLNVPGLNDDYCVTAVARDQAKNNSVGQHVKVAIDTTAPALTLISPADGSRHKGGLAVVVQATDAHVIDRVRVQLRDGGTQSSIVRLNLNITTGNYEGIIDTTEVPGGSYNLRLDTRDKYGNAGAGVFATVVVDNEGPDVSFVDPTVGAVVRGTINVNVIASDDSGLGAYCLKVDAGSCVSGGYAFQPANGAMPTVSVDTDMFSEGAHTLIARVTDRLGNATEEERTTIVDRTSPTISLNRPTNGSTISGNNVRVRATINDSNFGSCKTVVYKAGTTDEVFSKTCDQTDSFNTETVARLNTTNGNFPDASYDIVLTATDKAGNTSSKTNTVIVDNTAPTITLNTILARNSNGTYTLTGATDDPTSNVDISLDGTFVGTVTPNGDGTFSFTTSTIPADGQHTFSASSTDAQGNTAAVPTTVAFTAVTPAEGGNGTDDTGSGTEGAPTIQTVSTPGPISALSLAGNNAQFFGTTAGGSVLGANTSGTDSETADDDGEVLGTNAPSASEFNKVPAVAQSPQGWKLFGIAWYWILLLLAAIAAAYWYFVARRRNAEDANL